MDCLALIIIMIIVFLWEFAYLPWKVTKNIEVKISTIKGEVIYIKKLSARDAIYLVEYSLENEIIRKNVRCDFWGNIKEWI